MSDLGQGLLQKSQIHSDNLLKMVKTLKSENLLLRQQIQQLETKFQNQYQNEQIQELQQSNINLQQENIHLANKYNEVVQQLELLKKQKTIQNKVQNTSFQSPQRTSCQLNIEPNSDDRKRYELDVIIRKLQQQNKALLDENIKIKQTNDQLINDLMKTEDLYIKLKNKQNLNVTNNSMEQSQQIQAQNDYSKSIICLTSIQQQVKLIQEFYIISIPNTSIKFENPEPLVLFKHPIQSDNDLKSMISVLPMFCFPQGIKCTQSKQIKNDILKILQEDNFEFSIQIFTPNKDSGQEINNTIIQNSNPDQFLYAIIIYSSDFIADKKLTNSVDLVKQKKLGNPDQNIFITNIAYVILTYYPYQLLCYKILQNLVKTLKFWRQKFCKEVFELDQDLRKIDLFYFTEQEKQIRDYLNSLSNLDCQNLTKPIKLFDYQEFQQTLISNRKLLKFELAPNNLLQNWTANLFIQALQAIILEQKVAIIGQSKKHIAYLMILFSLCIKPLKYYHPFILDVPEKLMPLLDAPVPVFLGISNENISPDITEVVLINITNQIVTIKNLDMLNSNILIELENQLKIVFTTSFNSTLKQIEVLLQILGDFMRQCMIRIDENQIKDLFLQRIKETQIYQMKK